MLIDSEKLKQAILTFMPERSEVLLIVDNQPDAVVRCKDCVNCIKEPNGDLYCDVLAIGYEPLGSKRVTENWFCADGERR